MINTPTLPEKNPRSEPGQVKRGRGRGGNLIYRIFESIEMLSDAERGPALHTASLHPGDTGNKVESSLHLGSLMSNVCLTSLRSGAQEVSGEE